MTHFPLRSRRALPRLAGVLALSVLACAHTRAAPGHGSSPAPFDPPGPGAAGCVESAELKAFVLALEAERRQARKRALEQLGAVERPRPGHFLEATGGRGGAPLEGTSERLELVAHLATHTPPLVPLAQRDQLLHVIEERARAHAIPVRACGVNACPPARAPALPPVRAVAVALSPGEQLGPPLRLSYDYWWAQVSHDRARSCSPPASGGTP